jgi:peptide/nickel transport system permease protein
LLGGSVFVERIFAWPGMGRLAAVAAFGRDYPVVMGVTVVVTLIVVAANLLTDLLYGFLNPRIRWA